MFVRHAPLSVTLYCPSRSLFGRHALLSVTLFYACAKGWQGRDTRVRAYVVGRMAVRESTPDQTPGPSRARWMEGGGTVRLHHQRQLGLFTARGICMRTLRIPSKIVAYPNTTILYNRSTFHTTRLCGDRRSKHTERGAPTIGS